MPGITPSRYVRGISNPHSAYASAEIPENVTIFKNLSRWRTTATASTTISGSQFCQCHIFVLMTPDAIRAYRHHPQQETVTFRTQPACRAAAQFLLSRKSTQIHIARVLRMCGHLIYYSSRLSLSSWSRNPPLLFDLSQSLSS